jgi:hypothetical protein
MPPSMLHDDDDQEERRGREGLRRGESKEIKP